MIQAYFGTLRLAVCILDSLRCSFLFWGENQIKQIYLSKHHGWLIFEMWESEGGAGRTKKYLSNIDISSLYWFTWIMNRFDTSFDFCCLCLLNIIWVWLIRFDSFSPYHTVHHCTWSPTSLQELIAMDMPHMPSKCTSYSECKQAPSCCKFHLLHRHNMSKLNRTAASTNDHAWSVRRRFLQKFPLLTTTAEKQRSREAAQWRSREAKKQENRNKNRMPKTEKTNNSQTKAILFFCYE